MKPKPAATALSAKGAVSVVLELRSAFRALCFGEESCFGRIYTSKV